LEKTTREWERECAKFKEAERAVEAWKEDARDGGV
jgi:hypothetical protein